MMLSINFKLNNEPTKLTLLSSPSLHVSVWDLADSYNLFKSSGEIRQLGYKLQDPGENSGDDFNGKDDDAEDFSNINEAVTDDASR